MPLLTTKLYVPTPRPNLVARSRLIERLEEGLRLGHRLTLVAAPAGFGKTTLVAEWVSRGERPVAWLSLDEGDNDPVRFLGYLIAALQGLEASVGQTVQDMLESPQVPPVQALLTPLVNDLAATGPLTLVLDDYHLITADPVHQLVRFLLGSLPASVHLVICTREDPALPLAQLRARGQMTEVRERDLRFTMEETRRFLDRTMGLHLSAEAVAALESRTEGWIAGLQLAALALQETEGDAETFIATFAGDDRYVADYLVSEVLDRQPPEVRAFLRQTAILSELSAPLCDALTGQRESRAMLEHLEAANLFLVPLDRRREWYRYNRLFAEVLRSMLGRDEGARLHRRAAGWYESQGLHGQAIGHALAAAEADGETAEAERLIRLGAEETLHQGGMVTVRTWLEALPDAVVRSDGDLAMYRAWTLAFTGEIALAEVYADRAEACLEGTGAPPASLGKLQLLRGMIAIGRREHERATEHAGLALGNLGADQVRWRIVALWVLAEAQERTRSIAEAVQSLREARKVGQRLGNQVFAVLIEAFLARDLNHHGERREAVAVCQEAIGRHGERAGCPPAAALVFAEWAVLCHDADELDAAQGYVERGLALGRQFGAAEPLSFCLGVLATIEHARGEVAAAFETLRQARALTGGEGLSDPGWLLAREAELHLSAGDVAFAERWARETGITVDDEPDYLRFEEHLTFARLLLAQGRFGDARSWLDRLERFGREREFFRWLITVQTLQAVAAERSALHSASRDYLTRALRLAAPEGYLRAFLDEGPIVVGLLPGVRQADPAFVARLLDSAGVPGLKPAVSAQALAEPLSERELEVLGLIAQGLSNQEVAARLVIARGTVKRHLDHIYRKLGVGSRTQAVARARSLRLI